MSPLALYFPRDLGRQYVSALRSRGTARATHPLTVVVRLTVDANAETSPQSLQVAGRAASGPGSRYRRIPFVFGAGVGASAALRYFGGAIGVERRGDVASISALSHRAFLKGAAVMATTGQEVGVGIGGWAT